ncbi:hypothetical protein HDU76_004346 [Blyttiomyces sp. JEL0837]|nr:hypothetical protein HDU76_004346 [Blyttiomyces sp. JEL0837]
MTINALEKTINELSDRISKNGVSADLLLQRAKLYESALQYDKALSDLRSASTLDNTDMIKTEIRDLIMRTSERKSAADDKLSLNHLVEDVFALTTSDISGITSELAETAKKIAFFSEQQSFAKRLVLEGGIDKLLKVELFLRQNSTKFTGSNTDDFEHLLMRIIANVIETEDNAKHVFNLLDSSRMALLVPLGNPSVSTRSLDILSRLVRMCGEGLKQGGKPGAFINLLEKCMGLKEDSEIKLQASLSICKIVKDESDCLFVINSNLLGALFNLTGEQKQQQLKDVVPVVLKTITESISAAKEPQVCGTIRERILNFLGKSDAAKSVGLLSLGALCSANHNMGAQILQSAGIMDEIVDIIDFEGEAVQASTLELLSNSCVNQECRKLIASRCMPFIKKMSASTDPSLQMMALGLMVKLSLSVQDIDAGLAQSQRVVDIFAQQLSKNVDSKVRLNCIEALAHLSLRPAFKKVICNHQALMKRLVGFASGSDDKSLHFGIVSIWVNLSSYRKKLSEEEEQLLKLKELSGDGSSRPDPEDDDVNVEERCRKLVAISIVPSLCSLSSGASPSLAEAICQTFVNLAVDKRNRGMLVQSGAVKSLLGLTHKYPDHIIILAAHALAKIAITSDPNLAFKGERASEMIRPLVALCNSNEQLKQFEGLLALTNLASFDDKVRQKIVLEKGVKVIEFLQFSDNDLIRRAATEALCNMLFEPSVFESYATSNTSGRLRLLIALCDVEDFETRRAASGCLAILSSEPSACKLIMEETRGLEVLISLIFGDEKEEIIHRGVESVKNIAAVGAKYAQQLEAAGAVKLLRALARHSNRDIAFGAIEALQNMQKSGVVVLSKPQSQIQ